MALNEADLYYGSFQKGSASDFDGDYLGIGSFRANFHESNAGEGRGRYYGPEQIARRNGLQSRLDREKGGYGENGQRIHPFGT